MIEWRDVTFRYDGADRPTLHDVDLDVAESELVLVAGRTGSGKSTLLRTVNGLVPALQRRDTSTATCSSDGRSVREHAPARAGRPRRLRRPGPARPPSSPTSWRRSSPTAWSSSASRPQTMRRRVEETLDLLGIADLRSRPLRTLSGGQQQRVAIGAVLTMHPRVLVLDEPTSALDPTAAEDVLGTLARLVEDLGLTVLLAEHRMERVVPFADRLRAWSRTAGCAAGRPRRCSSRSPVAPPVVELGRLAGWQPLPLSVREARRRTSDLPGRLGDPRPSGDPTTSGRRCCRRATSWSGTAAPSPCARCRSRSRPAGSSR